MTRQARNETCVILNKWSDKSMIKVIYRPFLEWSNFTIFADRPGHLWKYWSTDYVETSNMMLFAGLSTLLAIFQIFTRAVYSSCVGFWPFCASGISEEHVLWMTLHHLFFMICVIWSVNMLDLFSHKYSEISSLPEPLQLGVSSRRYWDFLASSIIIRCRGWLKRVSNDVVGVILIDPVIPRQERGNNWLLPL